MVRTGDLWMAHRTFAENSAFEAVFFFFIVAVVFLPVKSQWLYKISVLISPLLWKVSHLVFILSNIYIFTHTLHLILKLSDWSTLPRGTSRGKK